MTDTPSPKIVRARRDSDTAPLFGSAKWLLYGEDTAGAFSLAIATVEPGGGPPMHVHEREDETYVVLSGSVEVTIDDRVETLEVGDCVFLPPSVPHRLHNPGPDPAQMLMLVHPPGLEHFLEAMSGSGGKVRCRGKRCTTSSPGTTPASSVRIPEERANHTEAADQPSQDRRSPPRLAEAN